MLSASTPLLNALQQGDALHAKPLVIAEWNQNRYADISTVDNFGYPEADHGYNLDLYPIKSITDPVRPTAGLLKGRKGEGNVTSGYSDRPGAYRTYTAEVDSKYKYWSSPARSGTTATSGKYPISNAAPYVVYAASVYTNKIYVCFENSWSSPGDYTIDVTTDGTTWTTVASNIAPDSQGRVILYYNGSAWGTPVVRTASTQIRGIRVTVTSMTRASSYLNVIEIGARLENDLSAWLISYDVTNEIGDSDFVFPIGVASSNSGTITFSNVDGRFNNDGPSGTDPQPLYRGLIDANTYFTVDIGIDTTNFGGSGYEYTRLLSMFAENWSGGEDQVQVPIKDASKFLQEVKPLAMLMENVTIGQAIWRILDSVGFNNYNYSPSANSVPTNIPYFWTNPDNTVWDNIQEICRTTQSAIYFDQYGVLQILPRDTAFDSTKTPGWTLDYAKNGTKQPDIVSLDVGSNFEANHVKINYKPTALAVDAQQRPISEIVWQPDGDVVLRSSALTRSISSTDTHLWMDQNDAMLWPYEGMFNLRGELIKYKGKGYRYYPTGRTPTGNVLNDTNFVVIYSDDEKKNIDNNLSDQNYAWKNYFTGYLVLTERGYDYTTAVAHNVTIQSWYDRGAYYGLAGGTQTEWNWGMTLIPDQSVMRLQTNKNFTTGHWYCAHRGNPGDTPPKFYGTRLRFPSSPQGTEQTAGIFFYTNASKNLMYGVEIASTKTVDRGSVRQVIGDEVRFVKRNGDGTVTYLGSFPFGVTDNQWIDVDVVAVNGSFNIAINGVLRMGITDPTPLASTGECGLYVRGYTVADFEYWYACGDGAIMETDLDNSSYLDIIRGGYYSNQYYADNAYNLRTATIRRGTKTTTYKQPYATRSFEEFGVLLHEVRPYDVKFEKYPVLYSGLYLSNDAQAVNDEYVGNPFGAKFVVANASRFNAVVNGDDSLTYGADNVVNQKMMITGRTVQQAEQKVYEVTDAGAVRARGDIPLEITSDWIQSEAGAKALGDWIIKNWANPSDTVTAEIYGNPLLQIGDVVAINYPPKNMTAATHKYYVLSVQQSWDDGITTNLSLRRAHI